ncbi:galactose oxidase [Aureobasidium pullulans]|uniref:Galactose oxidase n=1 Tax=Aureobasidium pullulans TaxID=5580 RepID=A0A4S8XSP1_AURPU|nr:galactose oxidase [Aureobasidium pullulans]THW40965.1 galactose oxidase [Aureobasidium pullulans]
MAEAAGVLYAAEHLVEGGIALAKGIYDPTLPLKATITPITDINLPRVHHSVSEVKGRAYVFGGKTDGDELADNAMHIIILPSSGIESTDYRRLEPTASSPPARYGHCSAIIDDQIYVSGGSDVNGPLEEKGRVWVFDTDTNSWSSIDAAVGDVPKARVWAAATASAQPQPEHRRTDENVAPQLPPDPEKMVPEPLKPSTYGTFVVYGGVTEKGQSSPNSELWTFDVTSRTWSQLPSPPAPSDSTSMPSITFHSNRLYAVSGSETHYLDLSFDSTTYTDKPTQGPTTLSPWSSLHPTTTSKTAKHPASSSSTALIPITTGQGRNYLLHLTSSTLSTLQLASSKTTAASLKDRARKAISKKTAEGEWAEVRYFNAENVMIQEGQAGRGVGDRKGFATTKVKEIDGGMVLVWGGVDGRGRVRSDGLMIEVEK